jgi:4'-phosphopantetheinyl transferase
VVKVSAELSKEEGRGEEWATATDTLTLGKDEVHVWRASLNLTDAPLRELSCVLAPDEVARAARFHFRKDHDHFVAARGILRSLLGLYLGTNPARIRFAYNSYGKPSLEAVSGEDALHFNVSHSNGLALYAFTRGREVGIDVEYARADFACKEVAERFFSASEVSALRALGTGDYTEAFFNCWTRKEAFIKALGEGLTCPLASFSVSLIPREPAALLSVEGRAVEPSRWSLRELHPGRGYAAALALEAAACSLKFYRWPG